MLTRRRRMLAVFALAELSLAMAIPFIAIAGYHALLGSRAGTFIEEPEEDEPGWRALVDPSPITAVVETESGVLTGIALLTGPAEQPSLAAGQLVEGELAAAGGPDGGGAVVVVPGTLVVDGSALASRAPDDAVAALATMLRLQIETIEVIDEQRWIRLLGESSYQLANPDPVADDQGQPLLLVGEIDVGGAEVAAFLGRPAINSDPITLLYRRQLFWAAALDDPPLGNDPLARMLRAGGGPSAQVVILPLVDVVPNPEPDLVAAEALIRDVVPIPAGAHPGDRIQVRVIDRTGIADLESVAAAVAATGSEVVEIGNAANFDGGLTQLVVPVGVDPSAVTELADIIGATTVHDNDIESDAVATLLVGSDYGVGS